MEAYQGLKRYLFSSHLPAFTTRLSTNLKHNDMKKKHEILKGKKLSEYQKKVLHVISDSSEDNYILEVFDINECKTTFTITNGTDDFEDVRQSTMDKLRSFDFLWTKLLPSSDSIVRSKYYIPERYRAQVYIACL